MGKLDQIDVSTMTKLNVKSIMAKMAKDLEREIDFDVLAEVYSETGWTYVEFEPFDYSRRPPLIAAWVKENCRGQYKYHKNKFVFELVEDASAAILKWK